MLTRPPPCLRLFRQPPSDSGDWKQAEFVIDDARHCPPVIPRLPLAVGKLWTALYQPFTATSLTRSGSETSRYRYRWTQVSVCLCVYRVRRQPLLALMRREFKTFPYLRIWTVSIGYSGFRTFACFETPKCGTFATWTFAMTRTEKQTCRHSKVGPFGETRCISSCANISSFKYRGNVGCFGINTEASNRWEIHWRVI